jgi:hypothetical protein
MNPESPGDDTCRITEILNGRRAITGDTALRLAHFFGTTPEFWLNLQSLYEIRLAQQKSGKSIKTLPADAQTRAPRASLDLGCRAWPRPTFDFARGRPCGRMRHPNQIVPCTSHPPFDFRLVLSGRHPK